MSSKGLSIRSLLVLAILLAGTLPLGLFLFAGKNIIVSRLETQAIDRMSDMLVIGEQQLLERAARTYEEAESMASNPQLFRQMDGGGETFDMKQLQEIYGIFRRKKAMLTLLSRRGNPVDSNQTFVGPTLSGNTKAFKDALEGRASATQAHLLIGSNLPVVAIYHPVHSEEGVVKYVARQYVPLADLCPDLQTEGSFLWLDEYGDVLHGGGFKALSAFDKQVDGWSPETTSGVVVNRITGEQEFYVQVQMTGVELVPGSTLLFTYPKNTVMAALGGANRLAVFAGIASFLLLALFSVLASGWISRPIRAAAAAAGRVARGDLQVQLRDEGPAELRQLSLALNAMNGEVRKRREDLEQQVAERTKSLSEVGAFLQSAMDSFQDALFVVGPGGGIRFVNREACELFQMSPSDESVEDLLVRMRPWFENSDEWEEFWRHTHKSDQAVERRFPVQVDGIEFLEVVSALVKGQEGLPLGRLWLFRDVTARERDEAEQRQSQKLEAVGRLAGGIAHDFNNILTAIQGGIEMAQLNLEEGQSPEEFLQTGLMGCQRAAGVVRQLLSFSRQRPLELAPVNLTDVVEETVTLVRSTIDLRIRIETSTVPMLPMVKADQVQIQQVIMNLVINASHAMETGLISLRCRHENVVTEAAPYGVCLVEVEDTGHGMTPEVKAKIFDPFFTTKPQGKGSGLGLATSIGIIERHGGRLDCESSPGLGTTFTLRMPAIEHQANAGNLTEPISIVEALASHILIVDDEAPIRRIAHRALHKEHLSVDEALDGVDGLAKLAEKDYDLVILDLTMPRMSGAQTLERIRQDWPDIPVLVWSGHSDDAEAMLPGDDGPDGFLAKPFSANKLKAVVTELIRAKRGAEGWRKNA